MQTPGENLLPGAPMIPVLLSLALALVGCGTAPVSAASAPAQASPATSVAPAAAPALRTGGQPTEAQLRALAAEGVRTVIDLRGENESRGMDEAAVVQGLGMTYVTIPISGAGDLTVERAKALDAALDAAEGPVLVHCASGNRVGALLALEAFHADGASAEQALRIGDEAGLSSLRPTVESLLVD